ncbi:SRPBCC domain-containing protein [Nocardia sp. NPDC049190]|uniref:SRPBCC domain-containing protein n=1 Tax=Nocardia sp. NPDC049190 TaxID=3155650 RepID=UPI0033C02E65
MTATGIRWHLDAPWSAVYRLLLDAEAVARWMVLDRMTGAVHEFGPRVGGAFRISPTEPVTGHAHPRQRPGTDMPAVELQILPAIQHFQRLSPAAMAAAAPR